VGLCFSHHLNAIKYKRKRVHQVSYFALLPNYTGGQWAMPSAHIAAVCLFWAEIFCGLASVLAIWRWMHSHAHTVREVLAMKAPRWVITLLAISICCGIGGLWIVSHLPKPVAAPPCPQCPVCPAVSATSASAASTDTKAATRAGQKASQKQSSSPPASIKQEGTGNQQTAVTGSVTQSNSGGCNQQVVGGNDNTNNCVPPERHLTKHQKDGIKLLASQAPPGCAIEIEAADSSESQVYGAEIHDAAPEKIRPIDWAIGWHPKDVFVQVKSVDDLCATYGLVLNRGIGNLGIPVARSGIDEHLPTGTVRIVVGEQ
jgi:hypothetical protein